MPAETCPRCNYEKFWKIRRQRRRCSRCRYEWRPGPPLRMSRDEWQRLLFVYLSEPDHRDMIKAVGLHQQRVRRAVKLVQARMAKSLLNIFPYNNTAYGPQAFSRDGHAPDSRVRILGILGHGGQVWAQVIGKSESGRLLAAIRRDMHKGAIVCSDIYQWAKNGKKPAKDAISHLSFGKDGDDKGADKGSLLGLEGFWKWLEKNRTQAKRKIRKEHLSLYLSECVWRYNHRALPVKQRVRRLMKLISQAQGN